jgi:hypothetical protein
MSFGLKNAPAIFSRVVVEAFKEFLHKFLEHILMKEEKGKCELRGRHSDCCWVEVNKREKKMERSPRKKVIRRGDRG